MRLTLAENPNCEMTDPRVYQERGDPAPITHVLRPRQGVDVWCAVTGLSDQGVPVPALARKVDDSGEGTCYLVYGGSWGLRIKDPACEDAWDIQDTHQWGEPFLLLPADGADLRFASNK